MIDTIINLSNLIWKAAKRNDHKTEFEGINLFVYEYKKQKKENDDKNGILKA